jgi:hypothetical protein
MQVMSVLAGLLLLLNCAPPVVFVPPVVLLSDLAYRVHLPTPLGDLAVMYVLPHTIALPTPATLFLALPAISVPLAPDLVLIVLVLLAPSVT